MWSKKFACVFILASVSVDGIHYMISNERTDWNNASCKLAVPNLKSTTEGDWQIDEQHMNQLNIPTNGVWIGYIHATVAFEYLGCSQASQSTNKIWMNSIGHCNSKCKGNMFGVQGTNQGRQGVLCACIASSNAMTAQSCTEVCDQDFICGMHNTDNNLQENKSLKYGRIVPNYSCLIFRSLKSPFEWQNCRGRNNRLLCSIKNQGGQWVANSIDMYPSSWVDANKICLSNATLPATVASVFKANFSDALNQVHWTGVIRTNTVLMADDADFITTHGKTTYAFMTDNGKIYFEERGYRSSLCTATAAATTRPTFHFSTTTKLSEGIETTSSTQSNPSPVSPTISDSTLTESFTSHQELKQFDNVSEQSPKSSAVGIGIGVSVAVICLVVATITIIVLKKRGLLPCKLGADKKQPAVEKVAFEENITYTKGLDDTVKNHNYFILEKGSLSVNENIDDYNTQCESNHENGEDGTYNSIEDTEEPYKHFKDNNGEYDYTTNNLTSGSNTRKPDNVYNKLKLNRPGDYNHVDGREHNVTQSGNDYDIKSPVVAPSNADVSDYNHITHPVEGNVDYDINTGRKVKLAPSDASGYAHVKI